MDWRTWYARPPSLLLRGLILSLLNAHLTHLKGLKLTKANKKAQIKRLDYLLETTEDSLEKQLDLLALIAKVPTLFPSL